MCLPPWAPGLTGSPRSGRRSGFCDAPCSRSSILSLGDPAPQMVGQLLNLAHFLDTPLPDPEQVIEVRKILSDDVPMRALVRETQLAEQLVEVPTVVSWSLLQLITDSGTHF